MHQRDEDDHIPGHGHSAALHLAALLTHAPDQDLDQDPGLTLIPRVAPAHVHMGGLIPVLLILDAMDAVMGDREQGLALVQDLMVTGALDHRALLPLTVEQAGKDQKERDPTGLGHGLAPLVATGAAALVEKNRLPGTCHHMNSRGGVLEAMTAGRESGIANGRRNMQTGTTSTIKTTIASTPLCITEVTAAGTERETDHPQCPEKEIIRHRVEEDEAETREGVLLTILRHHPHQGLSPALKS